MRLPDLLRLSLGALTHHPGRSLLSALGIAVGIAAVILLTALGEDFTVTPQKQQLAVLDSVLGVLTFVVAALGVSSARFLRFALAALSVSLARNYILADETVAVSIGLAAGLARRNNTQLPLSCGMNY